MLTSLALVFLVGLALAALCQKLKLPRIIGMLATGILLGPCVLNVLDGSILSISADLRKLALVIILLKAGLSLDLGDLKKVGRPAILMSCLPATCEIIGYVLLAPYFLGVTHAEAAVMGAVLAAVSPAVVVPRMVQLMESGRGTDKSIPHIAYVPISFEPNPNSSFIRRWCNKYIWILSQYPNAYGIWHAIFCFCLTFRFIAFVWIWYFLHNVLKFIG